MTVHRMSREHLGCSFILGAERLRTVNVPGYGEDGSQATPITRSYKQEHDGEPHQDVSVRADISRGPTLIRGSLQHQKAQSAERAVQH